MEFDDYLTQATIDEIRQVLDNESLQREIVEVNYRLAEQFFSYEVLEDELNVLIRRPQNIYRLAGRSKRFRDRMQERFEDRKS